VCFSFLLKSAKDVFGPRPVLRASFIHKFERFSPYISNSLNCINSDWERGTRILFLQNLGNRRKTKSLNISGPEEFVNCKIKSIRYHIK